MAKTFPYLNVPAFGEPQIDLVKMRRAHKGKALRAWWEAHLPCPCKRTTRYDSSPTLVSENDSLCECGGTGTLYRNGQETLVMPFEDNGELFPTRMHGDEDPVDGYLTFLPEHLPKNKDRVTLLEDVVIYCDTLPIAAPSMKLRWPVIRHKHTMGSGLNNGFPSEIVFGVASVVVTGADGLVDSALDPTEGVDFDVDDDGLIVARSSLWTSLAGRWATIRYYARERFYVKGGPHVRRAMRYAGPDGVERIDYQTTCWGVVADVTDAEPPQSSGLTANHEG